MKGFASLIIPFLLVTACGGSHEKKPAAEKEIVQNLAFNDLAGTWEQRYGNGSGYRMSFMKTANRNECQIIIFLADESLVFTGTPLISQQQLLIDVTGMKGVDRKVTRFDNLDYASVGGAQFVFHVTRLDREGGVTLKFKPLTVTIRGMDSIGYFEPVFFLEKIK